MTTKASKKPSKASPTSKPRAFGYVRVSTDEQVAEGLSLRAQRAAIRAYAKERGFRLIKLYADEGLSGRTLDRPALQELLDRVRGTENEAIIIYRLSRISRSTRDLLALVEDTFVRGNTRLISITEHIDTQTPMGRFFLTIMAALAQMERELISERTRTALRYKQSQGERLGAAPYGFKRGKTGELVEVRKELTVIRRIFKMRQQGKSYGDIADKLNEDGVPTKRGGKWYPSTVRYIVTNERYQGI